MRIETSGVSEALNSAVIVGGSLFDISTPAAEKSAIHCRIERDFVRLFDEIVAQDVPFLAACSGNGLLGSYLSALISRRYGEAAGCVSLQLTEAGVGDPLLVGLPGSIDELIGHKRRPATRCPKARCC
jgi:GMP synthase (glutamine-hydrolysing)